MKPSVRHRETLALALAAALVSLSLATGSGTEGGAECPAWLREAAALPVAEAQRGSPAVVLLDEEVRSISSSGEVKTRRRYAARLLTVEGRDAASLQELYLTDTGRVREMRGWVVRPSGEVRELDEKAVIDMALVGHDVYNEVRVRRIGLGPNPEAGIVFGAETTAESRSLFAQFCWDLQDRWPIARVVRSLVLPPGSRASSITFNRPAVEPSIAGATWIWSLHDLPRVPDEPGAASRTALAPRLAVSWNAPAAGGGPASFTDWASVGRWLAAQAETAAVPDAGVKAAAKAVAAKEPTAHGRLAALAELVQDVRYVSVQIGIGRGGGYRPRRAGEVLEKGHGDCKGKVALMRALLAALGQRAYPLMVFAGDPGYVQEAWPSPHQFNHVIVGIPVADATPVDAVVQVAGIGPLLLFDPTDPFTPLGELPLSDQGGLGLVATENDAALIRLPEAGPSANRSERTIEVTVDDTGLLAGIVRERSSGAAAAAARGRHGGQSAEAYARSIDDAVAAALPGLRLTNVAAEDDGRTFGLTATLSAPGYGQIIQSRLMLLRCPTRLSASLPALTQTTRHTPVSLQAGSAAETFVLTPATGLQVDELPVSTASEGPYGSYALTVRYEGGKVIVEREITTRRATVPVSDYGALRAFVEGARATDEATIVLVRGQ